MFVGLKSNRIFNQGKLIFVILITLTFFTVLAQGYLGPRYGKRYAESGGGETSRIVGRSSSSGGPRTIQSRSQTRFYAGSRYGGKRSYWPAKMIPSDSSPDISPSMYDCVYLPNVGVRCASLRVDKSERERINEEDEVYIPQLSGSQTRTAIIDTVPDSTGGWDMKGEYN